jgi:hypothetical protein
LPPDNEPILFLQYTNFNRQTKFPVEKEVTSFLVGNARPRLSSFYQQLLLHGENPLVGVLINDLLKNDQQFQLRPPCCAVRVDTEIFISAACYHKAATAVIAALQEP